MSEIENGIEIKIFKATSMALTTVVPPLVPDEILPPLDATDAVEIRIPAELRKMILVDSLSAGHVVEMTITGGTVVNGVNGAGKTSLLQLVPMFYGEHANRIVTAGGGKSSFIDYYLPRTTSYIVFEYVCHDGTLRQVALHADRQGKKVLYRFIRAGFDPAHYIIGETSEIVEASMLSRHLKLSNVPFHGELIEHNTEYRAVIQATRTNTGDRGRKEMLRRMIADFSLTTTARPIPQIEKLVSGMFRRQTNFEDLQGMVMQCIDENLVERSIEADPKELEHWPTAFRAYQAAIEAKPEMEKADGAEEECKAIEGTLGELNAKFKSLIAHLQDEMEARQRKRGELSAQREALVEEHTTKMTGLQGQKATLDAGLASVKTLLGHLETQRKAFEEEDIEGLAQLVDGIATLRQRIDALDKQEAVLLGEHQQISESFERLIREVEDQCRAALDELGGKRDQINEGCTEKLKALEEKIEEARRVLEEKMEKVRPALEAAVFDSATAVGRAVQLRDHPAEDPALRARLEEKRKRREECTHQFHDAERKNHELERAHDQHKRTFEQAERTLIEAKRRLDEAHAHQERMIKRATPAPGSLLHALQIHHPAWVEDIGKVIREELLEREDLSPSWEADSDSIYGLSIDLSKLPSSPLADSLQEALDAARAQWEEAHARHSAAQAALESAASERKKAEKRIDEHKALVAQARQNVQTSTHEFDAVVQQFEAAKREQRKVADEQVRVAQESEKNARQALNQHGEQYKLERNALEANARAKRNELEQHRRNALEQIDSLRKMRQREMENQKKILRAQCDQALREKGVDVSVIDGLKKEKDGLRNTLRKAEVATGRVMQWRTWKETEYARRPDHEAEEKRLKTALEGCVREIQAAQHAFEAARSAIEKDITKTIDEEKALDSSRMKAIQHQQDLASFDDGRPAPDYDAAWAVGDLVRQALDQQKTRQERLRTIRTAVGKLFNVFNRHANSVQAQYLELHKDAVGQNDRKWVAVFKTWFDDLHEKDRSMVLTSAKNLGAEVVSFRKQLYDFDRKIKAFNRELQDNLDRSVVFESISQVTVDITSSVTTLPYWSDLEALTAEENIEWLYAMNTLPPPAFADRLGTLLAHWEVRSGLRAEFRKLVQISGTVIENGKERRFRTAADIDKVSSNGLSYLVLVIIFIGFVNRIRGSASINITWALDELKSISIGNVHHLVALLKRNNITLVSAYPDPDPESLALFGNWYNVQEDRRLVTPRFVARAAANAKPQENALPAERAH